MNCEAVDRLVRAAFDSAIRVEMAEGACEVTLPLLDPLNDFVRVYIRPVQGGYVLSDYGLTMEAMDDLGVDLSTPKREAIMDILMRTNGLIYDRGMLTAHAAADPQEFARHFLLYLRGLVGVMDMEMLQTPRTRLDFEGVVGDYLRTREAPYERNARVPLVHGIDPTSRFQYVQVDFLVRGAVAVEALHATSINSSNNAVNRIFVDYQQVRAHGPREIKLAVVYNDESAVAQTPRFGVLQEVASLPPIPWSRRDEALAPLLRA